MLTDSLEQQAGNPGEKFRRAEMEYSDKFWVKVLSETSLSAYIRDKYMLSTDMVSEEDEDGSS